MSSPCWSFPHLLSSTPPQHAAPPGQRDRLQEDTVHQERLPQERLVKTSADAIRSESNAKESLSHLKCESAGNLRPNTPTFTEQGSSASQMTAAKVMDVISRLPGCAGQAIDAISAYTRSKLKMHHHCLKISKSENVQMFGYVHQNTNGQNQDPVLKIQSFLLKGICTVILWQDYYGKCNLSKFYWNTVGKNPQLGMLIR